MKKLVSLLLIFLPLLSGCQLRALNPNSERASDQTFLIWFSFGLMMIVLSVVFFLFVRFVSKYKQTEMNKNDIPRDVKGNKKLEITWTTLSMLLLVILAVPTVAITMESSPELAETSLENTSALHINVTARQYSWSFQYQNGKTSENQLILPKDKEIVLHLKSDDVIHSFWVPELSGKQDVLPGKEIILEFKADQVGTFLGKCAEFCGVNHTNMTFETKVITQNKYAEWVLE
ncbi:cytochrome c oxidase subunit II [Aquibacillus saliphilus]|uniref:cytochrome c oxidase subunit II n=1 Tax=Aquibacillus saliphilus TaxID=1909422 RepID=UPI001CEFFB07|nr:cytochrome c oxidase subunit II [Aquibacillus saliphilus]